MLARSILIYIDTPLVAAGIWKRDVIDRTEAQLYRSINNLPNLVSNKGPDERGLRLEERLGHFGAPGTQSQPAVEEADPA